MLNCCHYIMSKVEFFHEIFTFIVNNWNGFFNIDIIFEQQSIWRRYSY